MFYSVPILIRIILVHLPIAGSFSIVWTKASFISLLFLATDTSILFLVLAEHASVMARDICHNGGSAIAILCYGHLTLLSTSLESGPYSACHGRRTRQNRLTNPRGLTLPPDGPRKLHDRRPAEDAAGGLGIKLVSRSNTRLPCSNTCSLLSKKRGSRFRISSPTKTHALKFLTALPISAASSFRPG